MDKCEVFEIVKSVITSQKGGVLLKDINRDYKTLAGSHIPYKTLGYRSIEELLGDIPEIKSHINDNGQLLFINKGKNCEHLVKLVSKQKGSSSNKLQQSNPPSNLKTRKPRTSDIGAYKYVQKEKENSFKGLRKSGVGEWADFKEPACVQSNFHEPKAGVHSRKSMGNFYPNPSVQKTKEWKPCGQLEESVQLKREKDDDFDCVVGNRSYHCKPLTSFRRRESFHGFSKHEYRDFDGLCDCLDELQLNEGGDVGKDYYANERFYKSDKGASNQKLKASRAGRCDHLINVPNVSHGDGAFSSPTSGNHFMHLQSQKNRQYGSLKYAPEFDDWDDYGYMDSRGLRKKSRLDEDDGDLGRKINLISGSLRVTIKNC
ncbi:uncharacterized protein LOC124154571 [Ischnura elegans]|uniref:uncharacterized protein LOC124154571 n=1 Tax=Ischnura elegans TaxID=197161 RepID=UPI001ED8698E|nr:uncharacterized protein LOC124154571 [Ischnura elegans]XP_046384344.1 uncharacterized protein LOC124154571 [Ischnura elegans]